MSTERRPLRFGGYVRSSRLGTRTREEWETGEAKRQTVDLYAAAPRYGGEITRVWEEPNASARKLERKLFLEVLEAIERGELDGLMVAYLSRFMRNQYNGLKAVERILKAGGVFVSVGENIVLDGKQNWSTNMQYQILMAIAEGEVAQKTEMWDRIQTEAIAKGIPNRACYGYRKGPDKRLVPDPETAPWVGEIFAWRIAGMGSRAIAARLNMMGAPAPRKSEQWTHSLVDTVLKRRTYLGEVWHGKKRLKRAAHEPLLSEATWTLAQGAITERAVKKRTYLLAGVLHCSGCRYKMKGRIASNGRVTYYCEGTHGGGRCPSPARLEASELEAMTRSEVVRFLNTTRFNFQAVSSNPEVVRLRQEVEVLERQVQTWRDDEELREIDPEGWRDGLKKRLAAEKAKKEEVAEALRSAGTTNAPGEFPRAWPADIEGGQKLVRAAFRGIFVSGRDADGPLRPRVHFVYSNGEMPDVPRPGQPFEVRPFRWHGDDSDTVAV